MKTKKDSLQQYLLEYINSHEGWHTKGKLGYLVAEGNGYLPESVGRSLRLLAGEKLDHKPEIQVSYYKSKRNKDLAKYARLDTQVVPPYKAVELVDRNGILTAIIN